MIGHLHMKSRLKNMLSTDMVKVSVLNGVSTSIRMLTGLVSVKFVAFHVGPAGIALLGQLNNFSTIIQSVSNGGISIGVTKYVSEHSESPEGYRPYLSSGLRITLIFSVLTSLALLAFPGFFSARILHSDDYKFIFRIFGGTLLLFSLNTFLLAALNGFKDYRRYITINIIGSIVGLVFTVGLTAWFGLAGALASVVTFQSIVFLFTVLIIRKTSWFNSETFKAVAAREPLVHFSKYAIMALVSAVAVPLSQLIVRGQIIGRLSIIDAGLWEGVNRISGMYLLVITTSLSVYFLPRLAELKADLEIRKELMSVYRLVVPFLLLSSLIILVARPLIINILFSREFQPMSGLFPFQLTGDLFKMCGWILGYLMLAKAMAREYVIMEILSFTFQVTLPILGMSRFGTIGATAGYALGHMLYLLCALYIFRKILFNKKTVGSPPSDG